VLDVVDLSLSWMNELPEVEVVVFRSGEFRNALVLSALKLKAAATVQNSLVMVTSS